jgi:acyl phosphate:glycerol-3-phosphate acyltransferase
MKPFLLLFIGAYAVGSINFSILLFRILGKEDPRKEFSGNAGVTNVYRQGGYLWATVVLLMDLARAMVIALISASLLQIELVPWVGLGLILGNRFPCFHNFRGGKGVANYLGFTTVIAPLAAGIAAVCWVITYAFFRIPFVGSFVMVFILGSGTLLACDFSLFAALGILATVSLIYYGHKRNVVDLVGRGIGRAEI